MFILLGAGLGLLAGLVSGGRVENLARIRLRWPLLVGLALVIKEAGVFSPLSRTAAAPWLFATSLAALIAWTFWHRDALRGIWIVSVGMAMNFVVVVANFGHMPVAARLARRGSIDLTKQHTIGQYVLAGPDTHLNWLGDWISLPGALGRTFPQAYSAGDLVSYVGIILMMFLATRTRAPARAGAGTPVH